MGNAEEADKIAYNIIITAVSLARENVPAALAAYDHRDVKLTTNTLQGNQLLMNAMKIAQEMVTYVNPVKYLNPPDIDRLRSNISRIRQADHEGFRALYDLLEIEYQSLSISSRANPATRALIEVFGKVDTQSSIVVISQRNHDAEALAFNTFSYRRRGNSIIAV